MIREVINIETCRDCRHRDHTGGFTPGGAKPCCGHPDTCQRLGYDCFKRVIDPPNIIPEWCPLRPKTERVKMYPPLPKGYGVFDTYSVAFKIFVGVLDFSLITEDAPERCVHDGQEYVRGSLHEIPKELKNLICSFREYIAVDKDGKPMGNRK